MGRWRGDAQQAGLHLPAPTDVSIDLQQNEISSVTRSPIRTIMLGIGGRGTLMLVNMLVLLVTSRILTSAEFGILAIAQLCVDLTAAGSYSLVGIPLLERKRLRAPDYWLAFTLLLAMGFIAGCLLGVTAGVIGKALGMEGLAPLLRATAFILPARCTASFFIAALQRHLKVERIIWAQTRSQVVSALGVTLVAAVLGLGAWSFLLGLAASTFLELGWCVYAFGKRPRLVFNGDWKQLVGGGVAPFANRMLTFASDSIDRIMIGAAFGASPLGAYTRASNLVLIPINLISLPAQNALLSWFSRIKTQSGRLSNALATAVTFQGVLLPPATVGFCLASPLLVYLVLGPKWSTSVPLAQVLFVGAFARIGAVVAMESVALVTGYAWGSARRQLAAFIVMVGCLAITIHVNLLSVCIAVVLARVLYYALGLRFVAATFGVGWLSIIGAHVRGILLACGGVLVAFAANMLFHPTSWFLRESVTLLFYLAGSGALLVFGPRWLSDPVGAAARTFIQGQLKRAAIFTSGA